MKKTCILIIALLIAVTAGNAFASKEESLRLFNTGTPLNKLLVDYFHTQEALVVTVAQDSSITDDVITTFMIANITQAKPVVINMMRRKGMNWAVIIDQLKMNPAGLFVPVKVKYSQLPEMYRQVYREYEEARTGKRFTITLYDKNVRELANIKFLVDKFGFDPVEVMKARSRGTSFIQLIGTKIDLSEPTPEL